MAGKISSHATFSLIECVAVEDDFHDYGGSAEPINHFAIVVDISLLLTIDVDDLMCKKICPVEPCYHFWN